MPSELHITKQAAAQRQIDAAIRMLFAGIDILAVHTVVNAAHGILVNLDDRRAKPVLDEVYAKALDDVVSKLQLRAKLTQETIDQALPQFKSLVQRERRRPGNFLKHADRDPHHLLDAKKLNTEHLLLEASTLYMELGLKPTPAMNVYGRWHLAVYPHEEGDKLKTDIGYVHELDHAVQLQIGQFLLEQEE